jgi:hypothetical protein
MAAIEVESFETRKTRISFGIFSIDIELCLSEQGTRETISISHTIKLSGGGEHFRSAQAEVTVPGDLKSRADALGKAFGKLCSNHVLLKEEEKSRFVQELVWENLPW